MLDLRSYPFKTKPYDHQRKALEMGAEREAYAYFMEMGTGKSKVTVDSAAVLYDLGKIEAVVVIAPKGVYKNWPNKELPDHLPEHIIPRVAVWESSLSKKVRESIDAIFQPTPAVLDFFFLNVDAVNTSKGKYILEKFLTERKCLMVVDESTIIKNEGAKRTKEIIRLGQFAAYRRILTGSPITKGPLDLYAQCAFLGRDLLGFRNFYAFRNRYAILQPVNLGGRTFQKVVGFKNEEELKDKLQEFSYRVTKDECLDLPEKIYQTRDVELTKEQLKVYDEMKRKAIAEIEAQGRASASIVLTQLLRLQQITCGHLKMDDGTIVDIPSKRLNELMDILEEVDGKAIIWANYRRDIQALHDAIAQAYGAGSVVTYFGDTTQHEREEAIRAFQAEQSDVRFFIANQSTGGYGITLTAANTVIYYSNGYDLEKRLQSEDRAHRIGQKHPVVYIDLIARGTVDEKIIDALRKKNDIARLITGDEWKEWI